MTAAVLIATPDPVDCPDCGGEGVRRFNATRNRDGVWEYDEHDCGACSGTGVVPAEAVRTCEDCATAYWVEIGGCVHRDLCPTCGPLCSECRRAAAEDTSYDLWRDDQLTRGGVR